MTRLARRRAEEARREAESKLRQESERRSWVRIGLDAFDRDRQRGGALLAGGLAFRVFVWSLPFGLVVVTLFGFLADGLHETPQELAHDSGMSAAIVGMVAAAVQDSSSSRFVLLLVGLVALAWASRSAVRALWVVHDVAWELRLPMSARASGIGGAAFTLITAGTIAVHSAAGLLYRWGLAIDTVVTLGLVAGMAALGYAIFSRLPNEAGSGIALLPGAVLFGLGIETIRLVTAVYLAGKLDRIDDLYGALGLATVILLWLFLMSRTIVAAAMLNASVAQRYREEGREPSLF